MLRWIARGLRTRSGAALDADRVVRVLDAILADAELSARLDTLDADGVREEFLDLYEREASNGD